MVRLSRRVMPHRITGKPMAFSEDVVDDVNRLSAVAGRRAWPERHPELWNFCAGLPQPPAGKTARLVRQVVKGPGEGM